MSDPDPSEQCSHLCPCGCTSSNIPAVVVVDVTAEVSSEHSENLYTTLDVLLVDVTLCDKLKERLRVVLARFMISDLLIPFTLKGKEVNTL